MRNSIDLSRRETLYPPAFGDICHGLAVGRLLGEAPMKQGFDKKIFTARLLLGDFFIEIYQFVSYERFQKQAYI